MGTKTKTVPKKKGMSLEDVRNKYNTDVLVTNKIMAALKELGNQAEMMDDFRRRAAISSAQISQYLEQFEEYTIPVREAGRTRYLWAGTKEFAAKVREVVGL
jgi:hypothetical protein